MRKLACSLIFMLMPMAAQAAQPSELQPYFKGDAPYSSAVLSILWMDVYQISLWTDDDMWQPDSRYALSITYRMSFSADELVDRTCDEMQRHAAGGESRCLSLRDVLLQAMPDVTPGDRISAVHLNDGTTRFYKNGVSTGEITDRQFSDGFFAIWLGKNTSEPSLRKELVGLQ